MPDITTDVSRNPRARRARTRFKRKPSRPEEGAAQRIIRPTPAPRYVRPPIAVQPGPIRPRERRVIQRVEGVRRPAPKTQPGPFREPERRKVKRFEKRQRQEQRRRETLRYLRSRPRGTYLTPYEYELRKKRRERDTDFGIDTPVGRINIEAELEGRGRVAEAAEWLKKASAADPLGIKGVTGATETSGMPGGENVTRDIIDLAAYTPAAVYMTGAALKELAQDDPQRARQLWRDYKRTSAIPAIVKGDFGEALRRAEKHPASTALELSGIKAMGGRTAGGVARRAPGKTRVARKVRQAGATKRAPKVAPGTTIRQERRYSQDIITKAAQVAAERTRTRLARRQYRAAKKAEQAGDELAAELYYRQATRIDPRRISEQQLAKRMDELEALAEPLRAGRVKGKVRDVDRLLKGKHASVAVLVAQGIVRPTRKSLREFLADINAELKRAELSPARRKAAKRTRADVAKALADPDLDLGALSRVADELAATLAPGQRGLIERKILDPEAGRMSPLGNVAVREMGAQWNPKTRRLELAGEKLPVSRIERYLRSTGRDPKKIAHISQRPDIGRPGAYYAHYGRPQGIAGTRRTFEAARKGVLPPGAEAARATAAQAETLASAFDNYARFISQFRHGEKVYSTPREARQAAVDLSARRRLEGGGEATYELTPVPLQPQFGHRAQGEELLRTVEDISGRELREGIESALAGEGPETGGWVLVPKVAAERMREHQRILGPGALGRTLRAGQRHFRGVVLTTTGTTWPAGNFVEGVLRTSIKGAGPTSRKFMHDVIRRLDAIDPEAAATLVGRVGTGQFGLPEMRATHSALEHFKGARGEAVVEAAMRLASQPVVRHAIKAWTTYTNTVFSVNGLLETQFRAALGGRYARKFVASTRDLRQWERAVQEAAEGLRGTEAQVAMARWIERAYGQYGNFSPGARFTIRYATPFAPWAINALRFLTDVLPRDHPILTSLLAANVQLEREYLKDAGIDRDLLPDYLLSRIPARGGLVRSYGPFELAGDPLGTVANLVLPQYNAMLLAARGLDWRGKPLAGRKSVDDVTLEDRLNGALSGLLGVSVPGLSFTQKVDRRGLGGALDPFYPAPHDPDLTRAFKRLGEIGDKLDTMPTLEELKGKENTPTYRRRRKLLDEQKRLKGRVFKLSGGRWGEKPAAGTKPTSPRELVERYAGGGEESSPQAASPKRTTPQALIEKYAR